MIDDLLFKTEEVKRDCNVCVVKRTEGGANATRMPKRLKPKTEDEEEHGGILKRERTSAHFFFFKSF